MKIDTNEYQCEICLNVYEKGWTDEESENEMKDIWGNIPQEERRVICDDCFNQRTLEDIRAMGNEYKTT